MPFGVKRDTSLIDKMISDGVAAGAEEDDDEDDDGAGNGDDDDDDGDAAGLGEAAELVLAADVADSVDGIGDDGSIAIGAVATSFDDAGGC